MLVAACLEAPTHPRSDTVTFSVRPEFGAGADAAALSLVIDNVRVAVLRGETVVTERVVSFDADTDSVRLSVQVRLQAPIETLNVVLELRAGALVLFSGSQSVTLQTAVTGTRPPIVVPVSYFGPGANIAALTIVPRSASLAFGDSLLFTVTAIDSAQLPVASFYAAWSTSDASLATINALGLLRAPATSEGNLYVRARTPTGIADSVFVTFTVGRNSGITGTVTDAALGARIAGALLELRAGADASPNDPVVASAVSDAVGAYALDSLPAGSYTLFAQASGFLPARVPGIVLGPAQQVVIAVSLSRPLAAGQYRIVLNWGAEPTDLDSYLEVPPDSLGNPGLIAYFSRGDSLNHPFASLDNDVTGGFGPETITIYQQLTGVYRYHVHNFSAGDSPTDTTLSTSGARVDVYREAQLIASFTVPRAPGTLWTVFQLDGATLTPVNRMSGDPPPGGGSSAQSASVGVGQGAIMKRDTSLTNRPGSSR